MGFSFDMLNQAERPADIMIGTWKEHHETIFKIQIKQTQLPYKYIDIFVRVLILRGVDLTPTEEQCDSAYLGLGINCDIWHLWAYIP